MQVRKIDEDVWVDVSELVKHPEYIKCALERYYAGLEKEQQQDRERIEALSSQIEVHKKKCAKLVRLVEDGDEEDDDILGRIKEHGLQIARLTAEREKIERILRSGIGPAPLEWFPGSDGHNPETMSYEDMRKASAFSWRQGQGLQSKQGRGQKAARGEMGARVWLGRMEG